MRRLASSLILSSLTACAVGGTPIGPSDDPDVDLGDQPTVDGVRDVDTDLPEVVVGRTWPRTAATLREAMGERGRWSAAWQLDDEVGVVRDDLGPSSLAPLGSVAYRADGAWADDRAVRFDSADDGLVAAVDPFKLARDRSLAALFALRVDGDAGGVVASRHDAGGGVVLLAVDAGTGHLRASLDDGTTAVTALLPLDHRDGRYHDVLVVVDRAAGVLRVQSDLGRGAPASIAGLGDIDSAAPFALGARRGQAAAPVSLAYVALATDDIGELAAAGDEALHALRVTTERAAPAVRPPAGLPWVPPWAIRRVQHGHYTVDVDPRDLRVITVAHLWLSPEGDDANPGSASLPKRSIGAALTAMTGPTSLHLLPGTYAGDAGWWGVVPRHDVNVIAEGGRARITLADLSLTWQPSMAGDGVYETRLDRLPYAVVDEATDGYPWLSKLTSVGTVAGTPGSWHVEGGVLYVHTRDGRLPDDRLLVLPSAMLNGALHGAERTVYLEGLSFEGGYKALHVQSARRLVLVDTTFKYADGEGLSVLEAEEVLAFGARATANGRDGLAYSYTPRVLEVDCVGLANGAHGTNLDNGSTVHSGGTVIRLGGLYAGNVGPNVADVQGAWSWNLGTVASASRAGQSSQRINFYGDGHQWLREGSAIDLRTDDTIDLVSAWGGELHVHDSPFESTNGGGTFDDRAE